MKEPIENALRKVREADESTGAPDFLEARLLAAYRAKNETKPNRRWIWASAAVAASLAIAFGVRYLTAPAPPPAVSVPIMASAPPPPPVTTEAAKPAAKPAAPKPRARRTRQAVQAARISPPPTASRPTPQEFIEIPYAPALTPFDGGRVVRVNMPGASVRSLGLPVLSDRVQADVLIGDDGVARAIRFVSHSGLNSRR